MATATTIRFPGAVVTEREHAVPLDHANPAAGTITVFTREVAAPDGLDRPYLVFLQGGPGFEATRPTSPPSGWIRRALRRVPRPAPRPARHGPLDARRGARSRGRRPRTRPGTSTHFRADAIVRDCEAVRAELGSPPWTVLGQSFGGFTTLTYLSFAPDGLREALITGGLAPVGRPVDDIYGATYVQVLAANRRYFARYPGDRARVREIHARLEAEDVRLPNGDRLTSRRFRQLGMWLGDSAGFELLHHVLELPFGSLAFLHDVEGALKWERNPIYATLHESSYADGVATRWSAQRLLPDEIGATDAFTAEHVFPWMWEDYSGLHGHREAAAILAEHPWPALYDPDQLRRNEVPVAATIYTNDVYVERSFAVETAALVGNLRAWETNEYEHNGLRADGERVVGRLIDMVKGRA